MTDYVDSSNIDLFIVKKDRQYTGAILQLLEPFHRGEVQCRVAYNPFGLSRNVKIPFQNLYPLVSRRDDSDPNLSLIFWHLEAYDKVRIVDTKYGCIPTLEYGHVYFHPTFRFNLFDLNKVHLYKGRVMMWSCFQTYTDQGVKDLTAWATMVAKEEQFDLELRAYLKPFDIGFTPRNVKRFLNNRWYFTGTWWENKKDNLWPEEPKYIPPPKPPRKPRKKKTDGQIPGRR